MNYILEDLKLLWDMRKLRKKTFKYADVVGKEFKKGIYTKEHWDNFYASLKEADNYRRQKIRKIKLNNIKSKINNK